MLISVVNAQVGCEDDAVNPTCLPTDPKRTPVDDASCNSYRVCGYNSQTQDYTVAKICPCPPPSQYEMVSKKCVLVTPPLTYDPEARGCTYSSS